MKKCSKNQPEIWKSITGYENSHEISNHGRVRSIDRTIIRNNKPARLKGRILKHTLISGGYPSVMFKFYGSRYYVHRLVAEHFIENTEDKSQINHKDGNKLNNYVDNLEWVTQSENMLHSFKHLGHKKWMLGRRGKEVYNSRAVIGTHIKTGEILELECITEGYRKYGFSPSNVCACCRGYQKTSYGYTWKYK